LHAVLSFGVGLDFCLAFSSCIVESSVASLVFEIWVRALL